MKFFHKGLLRWVWPNPQETAELVAFTGETPNGGFHFLCSMCSMWRVRLARASAFEVYYAGKLQWHFTYGFDFRHSLWLLFVVAFPVLKGLNVNYLGNVLELDQHKMKHNFEKSFACPKCEKEFLQKDNMLEQVKKHSLKCAKFYCKISWLYLGTALLLYILKFQFCFCKILSITDHWSTCFLFRQDVHANNCFYVVLPFQADWAIR